MGNLMPHMGAPQIAIGVVAYIYLGFCLMTIAGKFGRDDGWMSFIPIVNFWYICVLADKPGWWVILMLIPFVNIIIFILAWWAIAEKCNKPGWLAILFIVPIVNLIVPGYIAFG
jgi:hypothetical protein